MAHWPQGKSPIMESGQGNGVQRSTEKAMNHLKVNRLIELSDAPSKKQTLANFLK